MFIKKSYINNLIILSLFFSSIIPFFVGCFFDFIIIPLLFIYWILNWYLKKNINNLQLLIRLFILISILQLIYSIAFSNTSIFLSFGIFSRISTFLIIIDLIIINNKFNKISINFSKSLIYSFVLYIILISNWAIINNLLSIAPRVGFPLYGGGIDPHVLGPAMVISFILFCNIFSNPRNFYIDDSSISKIFLIYGSFSTLITSILTGSRGSLLIATGYVFFMFIYKFSDDYKIKLKLNTKLYYKNNFLNIVLISIGSSLIILILKFSKDILKIIVRTFSIVDLFTGQDVSRTDVLSRTFDTITESYNYLLGGEYVRQTWDNGVLFLVNNQGLIICLLFLLILYKFLQYSSKFNKNASSIIFSSIIFTVIASETIFIPRFFIIYLTTIYILMIPSLIKNKKISISQ